jgi:aspartate kinase
VASSPDAARGGVATVLKFGGTSVEDAAAFERVAEIVAACRDEVPVVVTSAMSRVTDALVGAVEAASAGEADAAHRALEAHLDRHVRVATTLLDRHGILEVERAVAEAGGEVRDLLRIMAVHPGTRPSLRDEVVSRGERLSSLLLAAALHARGLPARWVDARRCIRTDPEHGRAAVLPERTVEETRRELLPLLEAGEVPVLGGFIGSAETGATTTLGRGGSDYSAALVGAALEAREIQIWTDVTGFLTADPRVVEGARRIERLSYEEAAELAYFGAKVLHPKTIQPAVEREIPVRICNSRAPEAGGTLIGPRAETAPGGVRAIAHKQGVTVVRVASARMLGAYGFLRALFEVFDRHRAAVDVVATSEVSVSLTLDDADVLPALLPELEALGSVQVEEGNAIVCVVGSGLRDTPGVAGRIFRALSDINVRMTSQGASSVNLTFVVEEGRAAEAVRRLHAAFFAG